MAAVEYVEDPSGRGHRDHGAQPGRRARGSGRFAEALKGVGIYDADGNPRDISARPERPGPIYQTMQHAIDVWSELGVLKVKVTPADVIAHGILDE